MKTQKNTGKNYSNLLIVAAMIITLVVTVKSLQAQGPSFSPDSALILSPFTVEQSSSPASSIDAPKKEIANGQNKKAFGQNIQMLLTVIREPFISKKSRKEGPFDVIIVPGIPFDADKGAGMIMKIRIKWAHYLVTKGIAKNVIFSGSAVYTPYTESRIMALYAINMGIPAGNIYCETRAEHSTENVVYSMRLAEKLGFKKIAIATGPYQSAFLDKYVKEHSLEVSFISIPLIYNGHTNSGAFSEIDPSSAHVLDFISLVERETKEERYQGTLGNKIVD